MSAHLLFARPPARLRALLLALALALAACDQGATEATHDTPAESAASAPTRSAAGTDPVGEPPPATPEEALGLDETLGRVVTRGGVVELGLAFDGRVRALLVGVGERVVAGQPIAEVEVPELAVAAAEAQGLGAQRRVLEARRARVATLVEEGLEPRELLEGVEATLAEVGTRRDVAVAMLQTADVQPADRAHLVRRGVLRVRAPRAGVLVELMAAEGGVVGPTAPLARLVGESDAVVQITTARRPPPGAATIVTSHGDVLSTPTQEPVLDPRSGLYHTFYPLEQALPHGERVTVRFGARQP
ncbi:MAG: efflux RND transporter periplasmic adaptor subunit [Myxococcales bacterium]|nr:efflux RND transporter periplasmic adaptor subunit [Myxococcales bacterium]MCB9629851.1 efflux RND transporter periplasmic adaptor subunit [Sandaracinaceae bacterium]